MPEGAAKLADLYRTMARVRAVEVGQNDLWREGLVSGEMHSGIGEEAIAAGVTAHLGDDDAVACDHRPTGPFVAHGADVDALLAELVGHERGLCRGRGGHMHLMDPSRRLLADGIVGASGPAACGFAFSAARLRPGGVAVAFFGEGAMNQGMLLESFNLATVWRLPVLFVCKDNRWSITTMTPSVSAGSPVRRARAFGLSVATARGSDVEDVHRTAGRLLDRMRTRRRPAFLHVHCRRPDGHLLGDPLLRIVADPAAEAQALGPPLVAALRRPGGGPAAVRARAIGELTGRITASAVDHLRWRSWDPLRRARRRLDPGEADRIDREVGAEVAEATARARALAREVSDVP